MIVFAVMGAIYSLVAWRMHKRKRARFAGRRELTSSELIDLFETSSHFQKDDLNKLLEIIANEVEIPKGLLRPEDRFAHELAPVKGWEFDDGLIVLPLAIAKAFGGDEQTYDLTSNPTVGNLVESVVHTTLKKEYESGENSHRKSDSHQDS